MKFKLDESIDTITLINRPDFVLHAVLTPNLKGGKTLKFHSVWPTSNKKEEVKHYEVTLDETAQRRLALLLS